VRDNTKIGVITAHLPDIAHQIANAKWRITSGGASVPFFLAPGSSPMVPPLCGAGYLVPASSSLPLPQG
jgi:hypothetical protein